MSAPPKMSAAEYGPWAVIVGGSEGVGAAFARKLAAHGINLLLIARKTQPLIALANELRSSAGVEARTLAIDVTQLDATERIAAATADVEVGLLICNAGASHGIADFLEQPVDQARRMIDLNVSSQVCLVHHYAARMCQRQRGGIILVSSMASYCGAPGISVYSAAKAFVRIFAEGLWLELLPHGVHVLGLVLGATRTPAMARAGFNLQRGGFPVAEPDAVAQEGLEHLAEGPVHVAGALGSVAQGIAAGPRPEVVRAMAQATSQLHDKKSESQGLSPEVN